SAYGDIRFGEKELIKIYPNPMVSDATIKISDDVDFEKNKVAIVFYNIVGSEVYRINQVRDAEVKISRDIFKNSGIYFYQLKVDESVMSTGRITVK
ncbi:MAG TPA: T9SS type A sorting domain-containing protein, partial [Chitinophagales bacterium]|nr:T9SS type A sorting domain-containing protein [Chitinophagales bacterium]